MYSRTAFLTDLSLGPQAQIHWQGGVRATQYVQRATNLVTGPWYTVYTNPPPTGTNEAFTDWASTNYDAAFYQIGVW